MVARFIEWELDMNSSEKRECAVERELIELQKINQAFAQVVADAQRLAIECRESADRCKAIFDESETDRLIDELDFRMKRGKYTNLRTIASLASEGFHRDRS